MDTASGYTIKELLPEVDNYSPSGLKGQHYEIVSKVGYLLGVQKHYFDEEKPPLQMKIFRELERNKSAKIIRNLCLLRTQLEINFKKVCIAIQQQYKSITMVPELIPQDAIKILSDEGIDLYRYRKDPSPFLFELNKEIRNRINNCKRIFPDWLNWDYLYPIFLMPDGMTEEGTKAAAAFYYENQSFYPYKAYMNWPAEDQGNILYNDKKFVCLLYQWNGDEFTEMSNVTDVSDDTKDTIYEFIEDSEKTVFMVDCENSDPYSLCAAIRQLDPEKMAKIEKIVLYDDVHAASAWDILENYISIPIEYILIERLKDNKSLADIKLAAGTSKEFYQNHVDSFVLVSSDSDYWGLIESIPEAKFLVMVEHAKCSPVMKNALRSKDIFYCYIDDFYSGDSTEIKTAAIIREAKRRIDGRMQMNLKDLFEEILEVTRIDMAPPEREQFMNRYFKNISVSVDKEWNLKVEFKMR